VTEQVADREARKVKDAEVKVQQSRLVKEAALKAIADTEREESARVAKMLEYREELLDQLRSVTPPPPGAAWTRRVRLVRGEGRGVST